MLLLTPFSGPEGIDVRDVPLRPAPRNYSGPERTTRRAMPLVGNKASPLARAGRRSGR